MNWKPIDTAPKDGTWILLYDPYSSGLVYAGCFDSKFTWDVDDKGEIQYTGRWTAYQVESWGMEEYASLTPELWADIEYPDQKQLDSAQQTS